jgi:hypothetical protein
MPVKLLNKVPEVRTVLVSLHDLPGATMNVVGIDLPDSVSVPVTLEPDRTKSLKIYVRQQRELGAGGVQALRFTVEDRSTLETAHYTTSFESPE